MPVTNRVLVGSDPFFGFRPVEQGSRIGRRLRNHVDPPRSPLQKTEKRV